MTVIAYARTVSQENFIQQQLQALSQSGYDMLYIESYTEEHKESKLQEALLSLECGDTLLVYRLDCLGKTILQLESLLSQLDKKGVVIKSLADEGLDTSSLEGQRYLQFLKRLAEMERNVATENTIRGLHRARKHGKVGGRPALSEDKIKQIRTMYFEQACSLHRISEECGVSIGSVHKYIRNMNQRA